MGTRGSVLADRIHQGAEALITAVANLTDAQWHTPCGDEQRSVGVLAHHVGTMYPIEASVAKQLAESGSLPGVDWTAVNGINADHATTNATLDKSQTSALILTNLQVAIDTVKGCSDDDVDRLPPKVLAGHVA